MPERQALGLALFEEISRSRVTGAMSKGGRWFRAFWQSSWILVATVATGLLNYLANMFVGRMLGPVDYGVYAALLAIFNILTVLMGVIQIVVTKDTARLASTQDWPTLRGLVYTLGCWLFVIGLAAAVALALLSGYISRALKFSSIWPLWPLVLGMVPLALAPLGLGILRGRQQFGAFGCAQICGAGLRLAGGIGLLVLGGRVVGAVASLSLVPLVFIAVALFGTRDLWREYRDVAKPKSMLDKEFFWATLIGASGYAVLTGIDVLVAKQSFTPLDAGLYASVSTVGKIALWISSALGIMLFPKLVARYTRKYETTTLLRVTQLGILVMCGGITALFFWQGTWLMCLLFTAKYASSAGILGPYGLAMTFYALGSVWLNYYLAGGKTVYAWILLGGGIVQGIIMYFVGRDPQAMVECLIMCGLMLVVAGEVMFWSGRKRHFDHLAVPGTSV